MIEYIDATNPEHLLEQWRAATLEELTSAHNPFPVELVDPFLRAMRAVHDVAVPRSADSLNMLFYMYACGHRHGSES